MKLTVMTLLGVLAVSIAYGSELKPPIESDGGIKELLIDDAFYEVISAERFESNYSEVSWMHIGRLQKLNSGIDLVSLDDASDWSKITFKHDESKIFAYRLYNGNYLVCSPKK